MRSHLDTAPRRAGEVTGQSGTAVAGVGDLLLEGVGVSARGPCSSAPLGSSQRQTPLNKYPRGLRYCNIVVGNSLNMEKRQAEKSIFGMLLMFILPEIFPVDVSYLHFALVSIKKKKKRKNEQKTP